MNTDDYEGDEYFNEFMAHVKELLDWNDFDEEEELEFTL